MKTFYFDVWITQTKAKDSPVEIEAKTEEEAKAILGRMLEESTEIHNSKLTITDENIEIGLRREA